MEYEYNIKDVERLTGIKAHTIRIWEKRYGIIVPKRTPTNIRYYDDQDLRKLLMISLLTQSGVKISDIASMSENQLKEKVSLIITSSFDKNAEINKLITELSAFNYQNIEKNLFNLFMRYGFEESFLKIILPLLKKLRFLWLTDAVMPVHQNYFINIIKRKINILTDSLMPVNTNKDRRIAIFSPQYGNAEILIMYINYLLMKNNYETLFFGQATRIIHVTQAMKIYPFDKVIALYYPEKEEFKEQDFSKYFDKYLLITPDSDLTDIIEQIERL